MAEDLPSTAGMAYAHFVVKFRFDRGSILLLNLFYAVESVSIFVQKSATSNAILLRRTEDCLLIVLIEEGNTVLTYSIRLLRVGDLL